MNCSLSGAYLGIDRLPSRHVDLLETTPKGGAYLRELARKLYASYGEKASPRL